MVNFEDMTNDDIKRFIEQAREEIKRRIVRVNLILIQAGMEKYYFLEEDYKEAFKLMRDLLDWRERNKSFANIELTTQLVSSEEVDLLISRTKNMIE